jgi:hypothetical protein
MSAKLFGKAVLEANTPFVVAAGAPNSDSTVVVTVCNHTATEANVRIGYSENQCYPQTDELIRPVRTIDANDYYEIRGIALEEGYNIVVMSDVAGVSVIAYGFVEGV